MRGVEERHAVQVLKFEGGNWKKIVHVVYL